jgi:hypothetical protein
MDYRMASIGTRRQQAIYRRARDKRKPCQKRGGVHQSHFQNIQMGTEYIIMTANSIYLIDSDGQQASDSNGDHK